MGDGVKIHLDAMPADRFRQAVSFLDDTLRECRLVLGAPEPSLDDRGGQDLLRLARNLVPDIEEVRAVFRGGQLEEDGSQISLTVTASPILAATMVHLQTQLVQLRYVGRGGAFVTESDLAVSSLLTWIWDEAADQIGGREPRRFPVDAAG